MASIRHAVAADGASARRITFAALCEYGIPADPTGADAQVMTFGETSAADTVHLVAEEDGKMVGTAILSAYGEGSAQLSTLFVHSGHRGKGIGRALLQEAVRAGAEAGYQEIFLTVNPIYREAVSLFEAEGWLRSPVQNGPHYLYGLSLHQYQSVELSGS